MFWFGFLLGARGSIGYAGNVKAHGTDDLSQYYESQRILIPAPFRYYDNTYPEFLVTANALVWKPALEEINGFNEEIQIAAGEDVDLGFRLREIGTLSYAFDSIIQHNFDDGIDGFKKRFFRYGVGNKKLAELYNLNLAPIPFEPNHISERNLFFSKLQYESLTKGYDST